MLPVAMKVSRSKQRKDRRRKKTLKSKREVAKLRAHQQRRAVIHGPASLIQLTLSGSVLDVNEEFFDRLSLATKDDSVFRYGWHNLDPWPAMARPEGQVENKNHRICSEIKDHGFDMLCGSEHGLNMDLLSADDKWPERHYGTGLGMNKATFAYNTVKGSSTGTVLQPGGVWMVATKHVVPHVISAGRDSTNLGRFAFQLIQGKHGQTTAFISAYRPVYNTRDDNSVYRQHLNYLRQEEVNRARECPREAFISDLEQLICGFQTKSYEVVVGLDANEDVTDGPVAAMFARRNMKNAILERYRNVTPPATYNRGRLSIDAIFHTEGLVPRRGGYDAFGFGSHRLLWVDFTAKSVYGHNAPRLYYANARRFSADNPSHVRRYNRRVKEAYQKFQVNDAYSRMISLHQSGAPTTRVAQAHNVFMMRREVARGEAARRTNKLKVGGTPYSPRTQKIRDEIELWHMVIKRIDNVRVSNTKIRRMGNKLGISKPRSLTKAEAEQRLEAAKAHLKRSKPLAHQWRMEHLNNPARMRAKLTGNKYRSEKKKLIARERSRAIARRTNRILRKAAGYTTKVLYKDEAGTIKEAKEQAEQEAAYFAENTSRFTQSENTPFLQSPLKEAIGVMPSADTVQKILYGQFEIPAGVDPFAARFLRAIRLPLAYRDEPTLPTAITKEQHQDLWKKQKENTASEPSRLGFHHFKAGAVDDKIAEWDAMARSLPRERQFSPEAWQVITDFQILKKIGVFDVAKMRTIQLMDADFNANNKHDGRMMMKHAEARQTLSPFNMGSRKYFTSSLEAAAKVWTCDLSRFQAKPMWMIFNDAKSCYDRIVHSVAILCMAFQKMPYAALYVAFSTLQKAVHHVRSAYGVSKRSYGGKHRGPSQIPLHGIGQGNGAGPAIWAVISTILLNILVEDNLAATFTSAISQTLLTIAAWCWVDDCDLLGTAVKPWERGEDCLDRAQQQMDHWEGLLTATGGGIVWEKSFWVLVDYVWTGSRWRYRTQEDMPGTIYVNDCVSGQRKPLKRHEPDHPEVTLGVSLAVDGNSSGTIKKLQQAVKDFVDKIKPCSLSIHDIWQSFTTRIMKTLEYPMAATTLTFHEWDQLIMSPLLKAVLPKAGMNQHFPRVVLYGPTAYQGMGVMHPWFHQELTHLQICLDVLNTHDLLSNLLQACFESLRLEIGYPGQITDAPYETLTEAVTNSWVTTLWQFAQNFGFSFDDLFPQLMPLREEDQFLMKAFVEIGGYEGHELFMLNTCRMFLHAVTLADISDFSGTQLSADAMEGHPSCQRLTDYSWPRSPPNLSPEFWSLWQNALIRCFTSHSQPTTLRQPMGNWLIDPTTKWRWFYRAEDQSLFHHNEHGLWDHYRETIPLRRTRSTDKVFHVCQANLDAPPIGDLIFASTKRALSYTTTAPAILITHLGDSSHILPQTPALTPDCSNWTTMDYLDQCLPSESWALDRLTPPQGDDFHLAAAVQAGTAVAASDGSFDDKIKIGTAAFQIAPSITSVEEKDSYCGATQVPGAPSDQSAYRSELAGVLAILIILQALCDAHGISEGSITLSLDSQSALAEAEGSWKLKPRQSDFDILLDIRERTKRLPIKVQYKWIKGHQDEPQSQSPTTKKRRKRKKRPLSNWAKMNIRVDKLAGDYRQEIGSRPRANLRFRYEKWCLWLEDQKMSNFCIKDVYTLIYTDTISYWAGKHGWTEETITTDLDWTALQWAMDNTSPAYRRWLLKMATGFCGTGRMQLRCRFWNHSRCPRCDQEDETTLHVLRCTHSEANNEWNKALCDLDSWMNKYHTQPDLRRAILTLLIGWHDNDRTLLPSAHRNRQLFDAIKNQSNIGVYNLLLGRVSRRITAIQDEHLLPMETQMTGTSWTSKFIRELWKISWKLWEHRNHKLHGPTLTARQLETKQRLLTELDEELTLGPDTLCPGDQHLVLGPIDRFKPYTIQQLQIRLRNIRFSRNSYWQRRARANQQRNTETLSVDIHHPTLDRWFKTSIATPNQEVIGESSSNEPPVEPPGNPPRQPRQSPLRPRQPRRRQESLQGERINLLRWLNQAASEPSSLSNNHGD
jgi:ribonuclease HI